MARIELAPGCTGMQKSLGIVEEMLARMREGNEGVRAAAGGSGEFYKREQANQEQGRLVGDLVTTREIILAHLDPELVERAMKEAEEYLTGGGKGRKVKKAGWRSVEVTLMGGNTVRFSTPYLLMVKRGRRGRNRAGKGQGAYPVLRALGIEEKLTPALRLEIAREVVSADSYREASEELARRGIVLGKDLLGEVAVSTGAKALKLRDARLQSALQESLPRFSSFRGKTVRIALDGGRARTREKVMGGGPPSLQWREPRVLTIDVLGKKGKANKGFAPVYETILAGAEATFQMLTSTLRLLGVHLAKKVLFIADGAPWIEARACQAIMDAGVDPDKLFLALDYYHATEKIHETLSACSNLDEQSRNTWFTHLKKLLKKPGGARRVIEELSPLAKGRRAGTIKKKLRYLEDRLHLMDYALLIRKHLSIGSGVVESAVRRVINLRFKSASMCWKPAHLPPLLYLRAILKSGRWDQFVPAFLASTHYLLPNLSLNPKAP